MKLHTTLVLLMSSFTKGYETISKSLSFPPPTPLNNTSSREYCSTEEDNDQCSLDDGALVLSSLEKIAMESSEHIKSSKADYS